MNKFQYLYIALAVIIWFLGYFHTGRMVRPKWKLPGKFLFYTGLSAALVFWWNHHALIFIVGHPVLGLLFHTRICKKYDINWWTCEPEEKYLELTEKWAKGDFSETKEE